MVAGLLMIFSAITLSALTVFGIEIQAESYYRFLISFGMFELIIELWIIHIFDREQNYDDPW